MSGRIVIREGVIGDDSADAILSAPPPSQDAERETSLRASVRAGLEEARVRGCRSVAAPAPSSATSARSATPAGPPAGWSSASRQSRTNAAGHANRQR